MLYCIIILLYTPIIVIIITLEFNVSGIILRYFLKNLLNVFLLCSFNSNNCSINSIAFSVKQIMSSLLHLYSSRLFLDHVHLTFLMILIMGSMLQSHCTNLFLDIYDHLKHVNLSVLYRIFLQFNQFLLKLFCTYQVTWDHVSRDICILRCIHFMFLYFTF